MSMYRLRISSLIKLKISIWKDYIQEKGKFSKGKKDKKQ